MPQMAICSLVTAFWTKFNEYLKLLNVAWFVPLLYLSRPVLLSSFSLSGPAIHILPDASALVTFGHVRFANGLPGSFTMVSPVCSADPPMYAESLTGAVDIRDEDDDQPGSVGDYMFTPMYTYVYDYRYRFPPAYSEVCYMHCR